MVVVKGVGTDLVEIARMERSLEQRGDAIARRLLTEGELTRFQDAKKQALFLSKCFAVKEAVSKALGTGMSNGISWKDIEFDHAESGQPIALLTGKAKARQEKLGAEGVYISLSDEAGLVSAFAVLG